MKKLGVLLAGLVAAILAVLGLSRRTTKVSEKKEEEIVDAAEEKKRELGEWADVLREEAMHEFDAARVVSSDSPLKDRLKRIRKRQRVRGPRRTGGSGRTE